MAHNHHHQHQTVSSSQLQKQKPQLNDDRFLKSAIENSKAPFRIVTTTLLSLLLPMSFLLLARLASARFLLSLAPFPSPEPPSTFFAVFLCTNPALLHSLVSAVTVSALVRSFNVGDKLTLLSPSSSSSPSSSNYSLHNQNHREKYGCPRLCFSWIFLCTLQVCVGLGIERSAALGTEFNFKEAEEKRRAAALFTRVVFFLGLHETMLHWSTLVVKTVVDDTVLGGGVSWMAEKWVQRGAMAGGFASLWYWRMRKEVEALALVAEIKGEMSMAVGLGDFAGWWLYYLTVTVGMVRVVKSLVWVGASLFCRGRRSLSLGFISDDHDCDDHHHHDQKV